MTGAGRWPGSTRRRILAAIGATAASFALPRPIRAEAATIGVEGERRPPRKLRWSPPEQEAPETLTLDGGSYVSSKFGPEDDLVVMLPEAAMRVGADVQINGGRHVRIIGGHMRGRLMWRDGSGSLFVEGLLIDLSATPNRDAIVVSGVESGAPDVYLQNLVITGVQGAFAGTHADVFQAYGPIGNLRVHSLTGDSNYQGFFIRPEFPVLSATFSRVNMKFNRLGTPEGRTFLFWCRNLIGSPAKGDPLYRVEYGPEVYAEANDRAPGRAAAFPPPGFKVAGREGREFEGVANADGSVEWPEQSGIFGRVMLGPPKEGDLVRTSDVGVGYRSPGYGG